MLPHAKDDERTAVMRLIGHLPGAVVLLSADELRVKYMSEAYKAYLPEALRNEEAIGIRFDVYVADGENSSSVAIARRISESGDGERIIDYKIRNRDGIEFFVDWSGTPVDNGTGRSDMLIQMEDVTERKMTERTLKESEARYRSLFQDNSAVLLLIHPAKGDIVDANQAASEYYGYDRSDLVKMKISQINTLGPEDVKKEMGSSVAGVKRKFEFQHRLANGAVHEVEVYSTPISLLGKLYLYSNVHDVNDRKQMKMALQESELQYRSLFDNTLEGIAVHQIVLDLNGVPYDYRFLDINPAFERMTGLERTKVVGKTVREVIPTIEESWIERYGKIALTGAAEHFEEHIDALGKKFEVFAYRNAPRQFTTNFSDVTDRKRMEEALLENEKKFHEIFDHANDAIHVHETDENGVPGHFIDVNEVACHRLGYTREEMLQMQPFDIVTEYYEPPRAEVLERMRVRGHARFETEHRRKDGGIVPVEVNAHVVKMQSRLVTVAVVRDITEKKRTINALELANKKLNLLSSINRHDLNNQLVTLNGYLTLLELNKRIPF